MKLNLGLALLLLWMMSACRHQHTHEVENHPAEMPTLQYTKYSHRSELFVEFSPPVVQQVSKFTVHLTVLAASFEAYSEGMLSLSLVVSGDTLSSTLDAPARPGIFPISITPKTAGWATLIFDIKRKDFTDQFAIDSVLIFPDETTAKSMQTDEKESTEISFLKEQAWKIEFANAPVGKQGFRSIIKTSGQLMAAGGDERIITANASGIALFAGKPPIFGAAVSAGTALFKITAGELTEGNLEAEYKEAKSAYTKSQADFLRASELVKDRIISEKEFLQVKLEFENKQTAFNVIARNYSGKGQHVQTPISGFIKSILINEGQFVTAGTPLAIVSKNKKLMLQANVSQKYFNELPSIVSANFKVMERDSVFSISNLNGKLLSFGKTATANSPYIPILFEFDNTQHFIPGSIVEVYLKSKPIADEFVIPLSAVIEEQGNFYVFVQTGGEQFQKREVKLASNDGLNVMVISGVQEGERIVTKGAYQIKLASAMGVIPAHGHEH